MAIYERTETLCVYSHSINGKIFYVGQGGPQRPYNQSNRTARWREHVAKFGEYEITIHAWTGDRAEAQRIEAELIAPAIRHAIPRIR